MFCEIDVPEKLVDESHSEYVYRVLKLNILKCKLKPGEPVNEGELAHLMNTSRTPVHEAVNKLRDERLIDVKPRKESRVAYINLRYVNEGLFLRCAVEPEMLKEAANSASMKQICLLSKNLKRQKELLSTSKDIYEYYCLDNEFHQMIYEICSKTQIYEAMHKIIMHWDRLHYLIRQEGIGDLERLSYEEHKEIMDILMFGNSKSIDLNDFYRKHVLRCQYHITDMLQEYSEYFEE